VTRYIPPDTILFLHFYGRFHPKEISASLLNRLKLLIIGISS